MPSERRCGSRPPRAPKGGSSKPERRTRRSRPLVPFGYGTLYGFGTLVYGLGDFLGDLFLLFDGGLGVHRRVDGPLAELPRELQAGFGPGLPTLRGGEGVLPGGPPPP